MPELHYDPVGNQRAMTEISEDKLTVKLDSQILNSMNLCAQRYELEHVGNWRPNFKAPALERGGTMHKMLDFYYKGRRAGKGRGEAHAKLVQDSLVIGKLAMAKTNITNEDFEEDDVRVFQDYVLKWQYDGWDILAIEEPFSFILWDDDTPIVLGQTTYPGLTIIYEGIVDLRVMDPKLGQIVVDTKTEGRKSNPYILSNQFQGYERAHHVPVVVNKIGYQKTLPDNERFRRMVHETGPELLAEWERDTVHQVKTAIGWHNEGYFPRNRTSCDKYSGCIFQKVCKQPVINREFKLMAFYHKDKPWDPYTRDEEATDTTQEVA